MKNTRTKNNLLTMLLHTMVWLVLVILPQIIINRFWGSNNFIAWGFYLNAAFYGVIFYVNYIWLVPSFYLKNRKPLYFMLAIAAIIGFYALFIYINKQFIHDPERERMIAEALKKLEQDGQMPRPPFKQLQVYYFALVSVIITGFSIGLRVIEQHSESEKKQKELEKAKLNSELAFLKNQVSPHFFFNTLNNIYSLIEINTKDAQDAVLKLSKLMRYLLYESEHGLTRLDLEINFMKHYIDLMKLRLTNKVELNVDLPDEDTGLNVPPLLFIPYIENAFKHGVSYRDRSEISISMKVEDKGIRFTCDNTIGTTTDRELDESHSGIGLENVKKRLNLLFPEKHRLVIDKGAELFHIELEIDLS